MESKINGELLSVNPDELLDTEKIRELQEKRIAPRLIGLVSVTVFFILNIIVFSGLYKHVQIERLPAILVTTFAGMLVTDFVSGFIHWFMETWGTIDTPIIGRSLMVAFREHHIDPLAFTRTTFLLAWSDSCIVFGSLLAIPVYALLTFTPEEIQKWYHFLLFVAVFAVLSTTTNQIHKWSHLRTGVPRWAKLLQKCHLILPFDHHHIHHHPPYMVKYCITNGLANYPLDFIDFWNKMEWVIETLTSAKPRQDDMRWSKKFYQFSQLPEGKSYHHVKY